MYIVFCCVVAFECVVSGCDLDFAEGADVDG